MILSHPILPRLFVCFSMVISATAQSKTVREFGATGDGTTDDTVAIQKAVDSGTGDISFPKGSYRLTKTITIELDTVGFTSLVADGTAKVIMAGSGPAFHFIGTHEGSADPNTLKPNVWEKQRAPLVRGLEITGGHPEANGIEATGTMQLTVSETVIHDLHHAIHLTRRNRNILISACHLYHNTGCGVFYDHVDLHQSNIVGCHISYNAGGGVVTRGGAVRNVHIGTCDIESNMTPDTPPGANVLIDSTGGSTDEVAITGCTLQHNSKTPGELIERTVDGFERYNERWQHVWKQLLGVEEALVPGPKCDAWIAERAARIVPCVPAFGADFGRLVAQLGLVSKLPDPARK